METKNKTPTPTEETQEFLIKLEIIKIRADIRDMITKTYFNERQILRHVYKELGKTLKL